MSNIQTLSNIELVALSTDGLQLTYKYVGGDNSVLNYSLVQEENTTPPTFVINFLTSKSKDGIKQGVSKPISKIVMSIASGTIKQIILDKEATIPTKSNLKLNIEGQETLITLHSEIVTYLAIPYFMSIAQKAINRNQISPRWLILTKLWQSLNPEIDETSTEDDKGMEFRQFTDEDYAKAVIESVKTLPNNPRLLKAYKKVEIKYPYLIEGKSRPELTQSLIPQLPDASTLDTSVTSETLSSENATSIDLSELDNSPLAKPAATRTNSRAK